MIATVPPVATLRMQHIVYVLFNKNRHPHPLLRTLEMLDTSYIPSVVFKIEKESQR